jgi:integrase
MSSAPTQLLSFANELPRQLQADAVSSTQSSTPKPAVVRRRLPANDPLNKLARLIAEALSEKLGDGNTDRLLKRLCGTNNRKRGLSIARMIDLYLEHADSYYRHPDGTVTGEAESIRCAVRVLRKTYGRTRADEFRPLKLKAVREKLVEAGLCRRSVNARIGRIKRMFKWAVENELIAADRYHALQAIPGLRPGRTAARDLPPVKPAPLEAVEATMPHLPRQVAAMVRLQLYTGMRPGEVCIMRTRDIDRSGEIWVYRPSRHKTEHHAHERNVFLGPKSQEVILPFLKDADPDAYIFSAAEADEEWRARKHAARKTPLSCGNRPGSNCKRRPKRRPGSCYRRDSYTRAIAKACFLAFPVPDGLDADQAKAWRKSHHWHPHQLRHNAATSLRKDFGIDAAQVILGHKTLAITAIYAEKDTAAALEVMRKVG